MGPTGNESRQRGVGGCYFSMSGTDAANVDFHLSSASRAFWTNKWFLCGRHAPATLRITYVEAIVTSLSRFKAGHCKIYHQHRRVTSSSGSICKAGPKLCLRHHWKNARYGMDRAEWIQSSPHLPHHVFICLFFCCLCFSVVFCLLFGRMFFFFFVYLGGDVFHFFAIWAGGVFCFLLFGRGACV